MKIKVIAAILVTAASISAQDNAVTFHRSSSSSTGMVRIDSSTEPSEAVFLDKDGRKVLAISLKTGVITVGDGVTPTDAAKEFARQLKVLWPTICSAPEVAK